MSPLVVACLRGRLMWSASHTSARLPGREARKCRRSSYRPAWPALRAEAGGLFERVERLSDRKALLVRGHVAEQAVLL